MLSRLFYAIRYFFWWAGNRLRRRVKAPDYIVFMLEDDYPELPQVGGNFILRRLRPPKTSLWELGRQFRTVAGDPRVRGVVLHLRPLSMPLAKLDVLRAYIAGLREAGKRVVAWSYVYDTAMYYLASAADDILLLPGGTLSPFGLNQPYLFLADALAQVGLKADFLQITPYKSAADQLARSEMSEEARQMGNWLADAAFNEILGAIAEGRKIDAEAARSLVDQTPCTDLEAVEIKAVDALLGEDDVPGYLQGDGNPPRLVPWEQVQGRLVRPPLKVPGNYVALMSIEGMILDGRSGQPPVEPPIPIPIVMDERAGDLSVVQTARQILGDKQAAAVVVYVDSRGGSATASESMRIALKKIAAQKPLVVVMGPVAASGGYWVSTPGKVILAQPNTITGSIGVILGKIADTGLLDKLLVNQETISRGQNIRIYDPFSPFAEDERAKLWDQLLRYYDLFLERVAASRGMEIEAVDAIGGGRVWTGRQALENGLVDGLGGLEQGLAQARQMAGLDERSQVRFFTPEKGYLPPVAEPAAGLKYALEGLRWIGGRALCLCPWIER